MTERTYTKFSATIEGTAPQQLKQLISNILNNFPKFSLYKETESETQYSAFLRWKDTPLLIRIENSGYYIYLYYYRLNSDGSTTSVSPSPNFSLNSEDTNTIVISIANIGDYMVGLQFDPIGKGTGMSIAFGWAYSEYFGKNVYFHQIYLFNADNSGTTECLPPLFYNTSIPSGGSWSDFGFFTDDKAEYHTSRSYFNTTNFYIIESGVKSIGAKGQLYPRILYLEWAYNSTTYFGRLKWGGVDNLYWLRLYDRSSFFSKNTNITIDGVTYKTCFNELIVPFPAS